MNFTTILVGNGLGRAIDPNYFRLDAGIKKVWNSNISQHFRDKERNMIRLCLPNGRNIPKGEEDLPILHEAVTACQTLNRIENQTPTWLSKAGKAFPNSVNYFIGKVGHYYHQYPSLSSSVPYQQFLERISNFIKNHPCHLATLNYDNLLYDPFISRDILKGYSGDLIDGFWSTGFDENNLIRRSKDIGWYLHLHGSPLYYTEGEKTMKLDQSNLSQSFTDMPLIPRHIVLAYTKIKPEIITSSPLLGSYWEHFGKALDESHSLIVFGYGGGDSHVNGRIAQWIKLKKIEQAELRITVIERKSDISHATRSSFWKSLFDHQNLLQEEELKLELHGSILNYYW